MDIRVVLVNEQGERVLDTLVRPQFEDLMLKPGLRRQIQDRAKLDGESIESVRKRVLSLVSGKKLVGYHLPQRLADFGILKIKKSKQTNRSSDTDTRSNSSNEPEETTFKELFDFAKIFNQKTEGQQQPMQTLCQKYLNLSYKRSRTPGFAVSLNILIFSSQRQRL